MITIFSILPLSHDHHLPCLDQNHPPPALPSPHLVNDHHRSHPAITIIIIIVIIIVIIIIIILDLILPTPDYREDGSSVTLRSSRLFEDLRNSNASLPTTTV